jgi:hypothetical protein
VIAPENAAHNRRAGGVVTVCSSRSPRWSHLASIANRARAVHPWIGATALLLSGVQVFLGLQLMLL